MTNRLLSKLIKSLKWGDKEGDRIFYHKLTCPIKGTTRVENGFKEDSGQGPRGGVSSVEKKTLES